MRLRRFAMGALSALPLLLAASEGANAASRYGSNTTNVSIPDNGGWVYSSINISGAPAGATVTGIDVHFSAVHTYSGDLDVDLNDSGITRNYDLWANEGGSADNPSRTRYGITTFNGLPVNGTWKLFAKDTAAGDTGYIDEWWIRVYYTDTTNTYAVYGIIDSLVYGTDQDGDGYYETYDFNICVDGDATPGPATIYARMVSVTTGQAWWSASSWSISGTATDYHCFAFDETDFAGQISGNTNLDFTVEIWNSSKSTKLATDTTVSGEPVKVDLANTYAVYGIIDSLVYGTDQDGDGYYETYDFNICVDGDATPGPATIYARMASVTTGQAWWSASSWSISGTATDYHCFAFDETDFAGQISGNTNLDFTVEIWNSSKSTKLATDTTVSGEPVKVDYVVPDTEGPKIGTGLGVLGDTKSHIDTYFEDRLIFADRYLLEDWSRRANLNPHGHNGNMQSNAKIETRIFDTDWFTDHDKMEDPDNVWNATNQRSGVDAHVYAGRVYDYLRSQLSLNGPANTGASMNSVVEVLTFSDGSNCRDNAFWNSSVVGYCAPQSNLAFSGALDIVGHEWGHALTELTGADLGFQAEPGALDEAFSDWLGAALMDHYNAGSPWVHGGTVVPGGNRNMANPPALTYLDGTPYPDTYGGTGWWNTSDCSFDACGRHINATVADKMFYLLASGGAHNNIQVGGLGVPTAMRIGRDANRFHWNSGSTFAHARQGMVLASAGYGSNATVQVRNAWAAVRVGGPAADFFGTPIQLSGSSGQASTSNRGTGKETGEPNHAGNGGGRSVWFRWTSPGVGEATVDTHGSDFDTLLAVYTGSSVGSLSLVAANDDDGSANNASGLSFETTSGTTYRIAVDGYNGATGDVFLNYDWSEIATLTGLSISGPSSVNESSSATYSATASWSDGTTSTVTPSWSENSVYATINNSGMLTTSSVTSEQNIVVGASYTERGVTKTATRNVTVLDNEKILVSVAVEGPSSVDESSSATYIARATWDDATTSSVSASWSENSAYATINSSGVLTTFSVTSSRTVLVSASYSHGGVTKTGTKEVTILNSQRVLVALTVSGPSSVNENDTAAYTATASWDDGTASTVTPVWGENSPYATIASNGVLTTGTVSSNQSVTVSATYSYQGVTRSGNKTVTILDGIPLDLLIDFESLGGTQVREACQSITAGPSVVVETGSTVTFRASSAVILRDGFTVDWGGSFSVELALPGPCS